MMTSEQYSSTLRRSSFKQPATMAASADLQSPASAHNGLAKPDPKQIRNPKDVELTKLDGRKMNITVDKSATGKDLLIEVARVLNINEKDYFGLTYQDSHGRRTWLRHDKPVARQYKGKNWHFWFEVKFYAPDPAVMNDDMARYYLCQQVQRDIVSGKLPATELMKVLLGSYIVQAAQGDYDENLSLDDETLKSVYAGYNFGPKRDPAFLRQVHQFCKQHKGQKPAEAELNYLFTACKLPMYGLDLHKVKDGNGKDLMIGVNHAGVGVYEDQVRINRWLWQNIIKVSYRHDRFKVKLRKGQLEKHQTEVWFKCPSYEDAKRLWQSCVEHHTFFRLIQPEENVKDKSLFGRFGSHRYRYAGNTQFQARMNSHTNSKDDPQSVQRSMSARLATSQDNLQGVVHRRPKSVDPHTEKRSSVEVNIPLKYMDSGLNDTSKSTPEHSVADKIHKDMQSPHSTLGARSQRSTESAGADTPDREYEHHINQEDDQQELIITRQSKIIVVQDQDQKHHDLAASLIPISKDEMGPEEAKLDKKEIEKLRKKREKEEKELKKREEKRRKEEEKEAKKKISKKKHSTSSSSSSSSSESDGDGGRRKKAKKVKHFVETTVVAPAVVDHSSTVDSLQYNPGLTENEKVRLVKEGVQSLEYTEESPRHSNRMVTNNVNGQLTDDQPTSVLIHNDIHITEGPIKVGKERGSASIDEQKVQEELQEKLPSERIQSLVYTEDSPRYISRMAIKNVNYQQADEHRAPEQYIHTEVYESQGPITVETQEDKSGHAIIVKKQQREITTVTTNERIIQSNQNQSTVAQPSAHTYNYDDSYDTNLPSSIRTITSGNRTMETIMYEIVRDGQKETHVEHRIVIHGAEGEEIDHDAELSAAILEATRMNPEMTVEKIEVKQETSC